MRQDVDRYARSRIALWTCLRVLEIDATDIPGCLRRNPSQAVRTMMSLSLPVAADRQGRHDAMLSWKRFQTLPTVMVNDAVARLVADAHVTISILPEIACHASPGSVWRGVPGMSLPKTHQAEFNFLSGDPKVVIVRLVSRYLSPCDKTGE